MYGTCENIGESAIGMVSESWVGRGQTFFDLHLIYIRFTIYDVINFAL